MLAPLYPYRSAGWFDPWSLLVGMRRKAISLGVEYVSGRLSGATRGDPSSSSSSSSSSVISTCTIATADGHDDVVVAPGTVVNAAGAFAADVVQLLAPGAAVLPVAARKRIVFMFECEEAIGGAAANAPLVVLPSGVYFRPESTRDCGRFICGVSPPEDEDPDFVDYDELAVTASDSALFDEVIWPALYERVPAFGSLRPTSSWAGYYEYNVVDQNAVIDVHPEVPNLVCCNGFSGHGLQQSPAAGRAVTELVVGGQFETIDLSLFGYDRFARNEPVLETGIV